MCLGESGDCKRVNKSFGIHPYSPKSPFRHLDGSFSTQGSCTCCRQLATTPQTSLLFAGCVGGADFGEIPRPLNAETTVSDECFQKQTLLSYSWGTRNLRLRHPSRGKVRFGLGC